MTLIRTLKPGGLHELVRGRTIDYVAKKDTLLVIRCTDGTEVRVAWVDENGTPVKGEPALSFSGLNVLAKPATMFGKSTR